MAAAAEIAYGVPVNLTFGEAFATSASRTGTASKWSSWPSTTATAPPSWS